MSHAIPPLASPSDADNEHVRRLLGQRATRADLHSRFPDVFDQDDSPSVYSHPYFSPPTPHVASNSDFTYPSPPGHAHQYHQQPARVVTSPRSPPARPRFSDDPGASILDLDDDSSRSSLESGPDDDDDHDEEHSDDDDDPDDNDEPSRMSYLGPKMRFHSRAPWETEDGVLEEDEPDTRSVLSGFHGRNTPDTFGALGFGRRSGESSRSSSKFKRSLDNPTNHSSKQRGALESLAQASLSSSSLISSSTSSHGGSGLRSVFSLGRGTNHSPQPSQSPSNITPASPSTVVAPRSPRKSVDAAFVDVSRQETHSSTTSNSCLEGSDENVHPYANPHNIAVSFPVVQPSSPASSVFKQTSVSRSDSITTVTESVIGHRARAQTAGEQDQTFLQTPRMRSSTIQGREISSPLPIGTARADASPIRDSSPNVSSIPGWLETTSAPAFNLISLEEARAQRSRNATGSARKSTSSAVSAVAPFPEPVEVASRPASLEKDKNQARSRARSVSAGSKARQALHSMVGGGGAQPVQLQRRESETLAPPVSSPHSSAKLLRHKKSGFMRIFNGRDKDKEESPPPIPALPGAYAVHTVNVIPKPAPSRVPVPRLSPPLGGFDRNAALLSPSSASQHKRSPPPLTIQTPSYSRSDDEGDGTMHGRTPSSPPQQPWLRVSNLPSSAPAQISDFPPLKLRPVSSLLSTAKFGDHIVVSPRSSFENQEPETPGSTTPSTLVSPTSPSHGALLATLARSDGRSSGEKSTSSGGSIAEDQTAIIKALQEQIVSSKMVWQRQIWELEGQIRDLKAEVEDLRVATDNTEYCNSCGRGRKEPAASEGTAASSTSNTDHSVVNRPRARTGIVSSRFGGTV
ncbi:hypothetical protein FISHEDRAFT_71630 [Fistulina hepatica ATCC 64428]|uniref:Uncharacterized protein n=1 Tax=Fistulina hepatica ATCC 64428 TaxID=1128425 RepID=A0A0D7AJT5_9AGAR|nr:hypothetical protein FISHEDRAFT_71630 [Fistulina hepatica ATCC 64428]